MRNLLVMQLWGSAAPLAHTASCPEQGPSFIRVSNLCTYSNISTLAFFLAGSTWAKLWVCYVSDSFAQLGGRDPTTLSSHYPFLSPPGTAQTAGKDISTPRPSPGSRMRLLGTYFHAGMKYDGLGYVRLGRGRGCGVRQDRKGMGQRGHGGWGRHGVAVPSPLPGYFWSNKLFSIPRRQAEAGRRGRWG